MVLDNSSLMLLIWQIFLFLVAIFFIYFVIKWYRKTMAFYKKANNYFDNNKKENKE